jgi:lysophospholipase L1-like esterase
MAQARPMIALAALAAAGCATDPLGPSAAPPPSSPIERPTLATAASADVIRVVTFGDSNTDAGYSGRTSTAKVRSYVSIAPLRLAPDAANSPLQLAGKIELQWAALRSDPLKAINHGITATTTGGGGQGGSNYTPNGSPNARTLVNSVSRFRAEVLGVNAPTWNGKEPKNTYYPTGPVTRANAFVPDDRSFVYVSMGTNDMKKGWLTSTTRENLRWMIAQWTGAGRPAGHFIITTLAPINSTTYASKLPVLNDKIRALADSAGVKLIDLAAYTSNDNGRTWKSSTLHVGDKLHYAEPVRDWIAQQVVAHINATLPAPVATSTTR